MSQVRCEHCGYLNEASSLLRNKMRCLDFGCGKEITRAELFPQGTSVPKEDERRPTLATLAELEAVVADIRSRPAPPALISETVLVAALFATDPRVEQLARIHGEVRGPHQDLFSLIARAWSRARAGQEPEVSLLRDVEARAPRMRAVIARLAEMKRLQDAALVQPAKEYLRACGYST